MPRFIVGLVALLLVLRSLQVIADEKVGSEDSLFGSESDESDSTQTTTPAISSSGVIGSSGSMVVDLTDDNFDKLVQDGQETPWFIEFYAPWCGHCKQLAPIWEQLPALVGDAVRIAKVDATVEKRVAAEFELQSFPTLKLVAGGKLYDYDGAREAEAMATWALGEYAQRSGQNLPKNKTFLDTVKKTLKGLNDGVMQVHNYFPSLLPLVFAMGLLGGFMLAYMCSGIRSRNSGIRALNERFDVKVTREVSGQFGIVIDPMKMTVQKITPGRKGLERVCIGDTVVAVNKETVLDSDDYRRNATGIAEFTLTLARCSLASNGPAKRARLQFAAVDLVTPIQWLVAKWPSGKPLEKVD